MLTNLIELIKQRAQSPSTIHDMAQGLSPTPKINPIIEPSEIEEAEKTLELKLPQLLVAIYTKIGNGGFGPGYGLYELSYVVKKYQKNINNPQMDWQKGWLPILTWGCTYEICVDCIAADNPTYFIEVHEDEESNHCLNNVSFTLTDKDGNLIAKGNADDDAESDKTENKSIQVKSIHQNSSFEMYMNDWVKGVDLWDEVMGDGEDDSSDNSYVDHQGARR
jgi:hypothetical protein